MHIFSQGSCHIPVPDNPYDITVLYFQSTIFVFIQEILTWKSNRFYVLTSGDVLILKQALDASLRIAQVSATEPATANWTQFKNKTKEFFILFFL